MKKKSYKTCSTCKFYVGGKHSVCHVDTDCSKCPNYIRSDLAKQLHGVDEICGCLLVLTGSVCPYYEETKDGQAKE
jgi:hypothetical protein